MFFLYQTEQQVYDPVAACRMLHAALQNTVVYGAGSIDALGEGLPVLFIQHFAFSLTLYSYSSIMQI